MTPRKPAVAIVGFTDHREQALKLPADRFELWGLNELYRYLPINKFSRWFELHERSTLEPDAEHIKALQNFPLPVYMTKLWPDFKSALLLPKEQIEASVSRYMTSSPAWMIGLAIAEGFEEIHVYGVDMAQDTEYFQQRACCEHLLGLAIGRGIKVHVPVTSDLMKAVGQYGYEGDGTVFAQKVAERLAWLHREHNAALNGLRGLEAEFNNRKHTLNQQRMLCEGAIQDCNYWQRSWSVSNAVGVVGPTPDRTADPRVAPGLNRLTAGVPGMDPIVTQETAQAGDSKTAGSPAPAEPAPELVGAPA